MNWLYIFVPVILTLIAIGVAAGWSPPGKKFRNAVIAGAATAIVAGLISTVVFLAVKAPIVVEKQVTVEEKKKVVTATPLPPTIPPTVTPYPTYTPYPTWTPVPTDTKTSVPPSPTPVPPTATPVPPTPTAIPPTQAPATQPVPPVTGCRDGEVIGVHRNLLERTPIGLKENPVVVQLAWKGNGFGGWDRAVVVVPALGENTQVFAHTDTVHMTRHCGTITEVEYYAGQPATYVWAMRTTAADGTGNVPPESEIGVYSLNLTDGTLKVLKAAPTGPSVDDVRNHVEVVRLK